MSLTTAVWYVAGIVLLLIAVQVLAKPLAWLVRALGNSIVGGLALYAMSLAGALAPVQVAVNPVSAVVAGMLGLPGVVALVAVRWILG